MCSGVAEVHAGRNALQQLHAQLEDLAHSARTEGWSAATTAPLIDEVSAGAKAMAAEQAEVLARVAAARAALGTAADVGPTAGAALERLPGYLIKAQGLQKEAERLRARVARAQQRAAKLGEE